jgi:quercetin dioxygenase-like cupin family protein
MLERDNNRLHELKNNPNLNHLEELTNKICTFSDIVEKREENYIIMEMEKGTCLGFNLLNKPEIAVGNFFISKDSTFIKHSHKQIEYLIVYKGKMTIDVYDSEQKNIIETHTLEPGDCFKLEKDTFHSHDFSEDTWALAITIPRDEGFPTTSPRD